MNSILINLKYWWYSREQSRLLVLLVLVCILTLISLMVRSAVVRQVQLEQLNCLALNIYHEARGEPEAGQYAVAEVTMNRVASDYYPDTICQVVYQQNWDSIRKRYVGAFSWTELDDRKTDPESRAWRRARQIAHAIYFEKVEPRVEGAVFYHAKYTRPSWARKQIEVARIGRHIFYK